MVALPTTSCDAAEQAFAAATTPCTYQVLPTTTLVIGPGGTLLVPTEQLATASGENARGPTTDVYYGPYLFYALNSADGSIKWSVDTYDPILNSPAIGADGTIYMECAGLGPSGDVCAYSSAGTELWDYDTQYALGSLGPTDVQGSYGINSSPAIGADGTIYVGDVYGHLWAIGPGPTGTLLKMSKLVFELHSPINILVTLPDGQQAGFDAAGTLVNTAGATVIPPDPAMGQLETVSFADPTAGQYELQIFGTGAGPFTVTAQSFGTDGSVLGSTSYTGTATNGSEQTSYLGLVGGGQMSMLLNLGLSNSLLTLGCAPVSMRAGATTTCTATLLDASGSITGENIKFSETMNSEGVDFPSPSSCTIISGDSCSVVVTSTGTGTATIQASYAGDASNAATSAESSLAITSAQSSTGVSCAPLPVAVGSASTCTATVTGASPTGALTWTTSGVGGFGAASTCKLSAGTCSVAYTPASSGTPVTISALYIGDSDNNGSSGAFSLVVTKASTTTSVSCQPASAPVDSPFACTAVVGGLSPGGTVSFASTQQHRDIQPLERRVRALGRTVFRNIHGFRGRHPHDNRYVWW